MTRLLLAAFVAAILACACGAGTSDPTDPKSVALDWSRAILEEDRDAAITVWNPTLQQDDFDRAFDNSTSLIGGCTDAEVKQTLFQQGYLPYLSGVTVVFDSVCIDRKEDEWNSAKTSDRAGVVLNLIEGKWYVSSGFTLELQ